MTKTNNDRDEVKWCDCKCHKHGAGYCGRCMDNHIVKSCNDCETQHEILNPTNIGCQ